ncbi:hypothetical protein F5B20DRAFT_543517 [Whalleya microplaca]|nr:hypothetical protein F5B20DRAFT_543517 [Whalleya microplaca]
MNMDSDTQHTTSSIDKNDGVTNGSAEDLTGLPNDVFLLIVRHLSSQDLVLCRRVSRAWFEAFTNIDLSWNLMKWHFPRTREMRNASELGERPDWSSIYPKVARRYYHLQSAKPRLIEKIDVVQEAMLKGARRSVAPWNRWLLFNEHTATFQQRDPTWCLDDGLLVYQEHISEHYVAYDLETRHRFAVPFDGSDKTVRRLRLACGVLIIEWCEREPYHQLNDRESVHRHFASAFDVKRSVTNASSEPPFSWTITFRSEWKIHFLGLPLNRYDRFFSAHTANHYALYLWQPNRSPWGEEDPLEQLTIWDISSPCPYRPSLDPTGANRPGSPDRGPIVVNRLSWRDLEFLGLRQRHTPSLREILLDDANFYVHEEEHRWLDGQHSSLSPPRNHHVRCTGLPFSCTGPRWFDECCADGDVHMNFCPRSGSAARISNSERLGRFDGTWPGWAPCWRHEEFPYLTVSEMVDARAGVRIVARQCFMMEALSSFVLPKISFEADSEDDPEVRFGDELWPELLKNGRIAGDERWVVGEDRDGRVTIVRF